MDGNIFNSEGVHIAWVRGSDIFDVSGKKLYELKGTCIYKIGGGLVGHLTAVGSERRLDKSMDRLFQLPGRKAKPRS